MTKQPLIDDINRVLNALRYSLASYLRFARPWVEVTSQSIEERIGHVAEDHRQHVARLGEALVERHGHVESRTFPKCFTALNDLSIDYLLPLVIEDENQIVQIIEATTLPEFDADMSDLVADILNTERRHLRTLERAPGQRCSTRSSACVDPGHQTSGRPAANVVTDDELVGRLQRDNVKTVAGASA